MRLSVGGYGPGESEWYSGSFTYTVADGVVERDISTRFSKSMEFTRPREVSVFLDIGAIQADGVNTTVRLKGKVDGVNYGVIDQTIVPAGDSPVLLVGPIKVDMHLQITFQLSGAVAATRTVHYRVISTYL